MTDTGAGTPLTAEEEAMWREALRDAPSLQRGLAPRDSSLLMVTIAEWSDRARRLLATLDAARSRPATDPAGLDVRRLREAAEMWLLNYSEVEEYSNGERGCTQLDHGHEEYEQRMDLIVALRAALPVEETGRS